MNKILSFDINIKSHHASQDSKTFLCGLFLKNISKFKTQSRITKLKGIFQPQLDKYFPK